MSAVPRKPKPDPDKAAQVVHDLAKLRPKIAKARAKLEKLYGEQKGLYVDGHLAGAPIAQMAKAGAALQAEGLPLAANQVRINLLDRAIETNGVLDLARKHRVTLIAYSPLAQGILTGRYHDDPAAVRALPYGRRSRLSPSSRFLTSRGLARSAPLIDALRAVGAAHGATPAQVALAWLVSYYGDTVVAIPGASRPEQATAAAAAMDLRLSAAEMASLDAISAAVTKR